MVTQGASITFTISEWRALADATRAQAGDPKPEADLTWIAEAIDSKVTAALLPSQDDAGSDEPRNIIAPDRNVSTSLLVPGCEVWRWTEPAAGGRVRVPLPCHDDQHVQAMPSQQTAAVCRRCSTAFDLELAEESDGGYAARLVVAEVPVALSRRNPTR